MKNARLPLEHIRQAMRFLLDHVHAKEDMEEDAVLRYAVERNFAVIGEAAKRVPESVRKENPQIPWKEMAGMRDMIIHEYDEIDLDESCRVHSPQLAAFPFAFTSTDSMTA